MKRNALILHSTVTKWSTLVMDVALARSLGFEGMELSAAKLRNYLDAGYSQSELTGLLAGVDIPAMGFILDLERQGDGFADLQGEAEEQFRLAHMAGARAVQIITGPVDVRAVVAFHAKKTYPGYRGLLGLPIDDQVALTAANLALLADMAANYGLLVYLEALAWTPLNSLDLQLRIIERANRANIRIVVDFWHCYASGDGPERVAKVPRELIFGVHVCDSLPFSGGIPDEGVLRDVSTGSGVLDLQDWVDAVKATGYDGWWSGELFCKRDQQGHSPTVAADLKALVAALVLGDGAVPRPREKASRI